MKIQGFCKNDEKNVGFWGWDLKERSSGCSVNYNYCFIKASISVFNFGR